MTKIIEVGATDLIVGVLASAGFEATSKAIKGLVDVELDLVEAKKPIAADNDPAYMIRKGYVTGSGKIKVTGIPLADYALLTAAVIGTSGAIAYGEEKADVFGGFSFKVDYDVDGTVSQNMLMVHKVVFGIPTEGAVQPGEDGTETRSVEIPFDCYPAFYEQGSTTRRRTVTKLNSTAQSTLWTTLKAKCFTPADAPLSE